MSEQERQGLDSLKLRQKAREFAMAAVDVQRSGFKRFGVWGDWDAPYLTLEPEYEAAQLGVFGEVRFLGSHSHAWMPFLRSWCLFICSALERD
jgi:isoleucyl-tRNA synthetase